MQALHFAAFLIAAFALEYVSSSCPAIPEPKAEDLAIKWEGGYFEWPCAITKNIFLSTNRYIPKNNIATRLQIYKDEAYVAIPRYRPGVPVTLGRICLKQRTCDPLIKPFPCWSQQEEGNCEAFQNVVDIFIDCNDVLWVLDIGVVNTLECKPIRRCAPKVVGICLKTKKVIKVIDLSNLVCPTSRLQYIVADVSKEGCTYLYISDAATRSIIVYDVHRNRGLRVLLPKAVTVGCCGRRDVLYLALVRRSCGTSVLYLTYLSSANLFSIRTEFLRRGASNGRLVCIGRKPAKIVILGTDGGHSIFFRYEGQLEVFRWDTTKCFKPDNFVLVWRDDSCLLATHVAPDYKKCRMQVLASNFQDYLQKTVGCGAVQKIAVLQGCF